jgi:hypothetical protein
LTAAGCRLVQARAAATQALAAVLQLTRFVHSGTRWTAPTRMRASLTQAGVWLEAELDEVERRLRCAPPTRTAPPATA